MGKRKERRLAALSNAGRRVKLDLFADPSEDLGGSSVHEEVVGEPKHHAGLPNSPSSSGQQPPNPFLLLGQYSDDELDNESDKRLQHGALDGSLSDHDDQAKEPLSETCKDAEVDAGEGADTLKINQQNMEKDSSPIANQNVIGVSSKGDINVSSESVKKNDSTEQISFAGTSEVLPGDVGSGWRIVMHEESNQYYYWNVETGETSWEVPNVLAPINQSTSDQMASTVENTEAVHVGLQDIKSTLSAPPAGDNLILQNETYNNEPQLDEQDGGCETEVHEDKNWISDVNRNEFRISRPEVVDDHLTNESSRNYKHDVLASDENKTGMNLTAHLLKQGELLLQRLKSLKVSEDNFQSQGWMSNCILEVEIRLSDIKSLLSYGSSLVPFWVHCEKQLKQLEAVINDKIYELAKSAVMDETEETPASAGEKLKTEESSQNEVEADNGNNYNPCSSTPGISHTSTDFDTLTVVNSESINQVASSNVACSVNSFGSPTHFENQAEIGEMVEEDTLFGEANFKTGVHIEEDIDMDVDMEVEDAIPASSIPLRDVALTRLEQENPTADYSAVPQPPADEWIPPPPPDNEHIPPPPPDNEDVPPPPPDEPPEHSYPLPSFVETLPITYVEPYNLSYSDSGYQYYGHAVSEVPIGSYYVHADGSQVAAPPVSIYYQAAPNTYSETAPPSVNPVEPSTFYDLQGKGASSMTIAVGTNSSQLHSEAGPISYNTLASGQHGSVDEHVVGGRGVRVNVTIAKEKTEVASEGTSSTVDTIEAPASISVKESFSAAAASSSAPKFQSKAARTKKRTVAVASSLRSNKKVSSLVDKWKAAKEELHENAEDEPEDPYEKLEKKRQREIEEWHAQQIASGEAKDNANFQPLGGDWREKVKRRRAQKAKEAAETPSEVLPDGNQQPDLDEISRDLPSGWQAYWDETSKQVYYGNVNTSETTWIIPKK